MNDDKLKELDEFIDNLEIMLRGSKSLAFVHKDGEIQLYVAKSLTLNLITAYRQLEKANAELLAALEPFNILCWDAITVKECNRAATAYNKYKGE